MSASAKSEASVSAKSEASVQAEVRIAASAKGWRLFRNNVGVLRDERGIPVRFGLANDSKQLNAIVKSADLLGVRPVLITQEMVGTIIGQFVSVEVKAAGWKPSKSNKHEQAQRNWADMIHAMGGHAVFFTDKEQL